jgi:hypothetical protein
MTPHGSSPPPATSRPMSRSSRGARPTGSLQRTKVWLPTWRESETREAKKIPRYA